nr:hypothetical protein [Chromobacterium sp. ASV5]
MIRKAWLALALPLLLAMASPPWEQGTLVAVGASPLIRLGVERSDGVVLTLRPAEAGQGVDQAQLRALQGQTGRKVRYRVARCDNAPAFGKAVILRQVEVMP